MLASRPLPTAGSWLHNFLIMTLHGTPNAKSRSRRGETEGDGEARVRCKDMEQLERLQGKISSIFAAEAPKGRLRSARGRFFPAVSFIT
jgi:hypothetical protein